MGLSVAMEQSYKNLIITDESAFDERVWQIITWNGVVVYAKQFVKVDFICHNFLAKSSEVEDTVVNYSFTVRVE
jgi:hypothetical protein